ncbi:MAG TPA: FHA domain-containing protein [Gemmatimonadales bacterium]
MTTPSGSPPSGATGARSASIACPSCLAPVTLGLPFCPSCGSRVMTAGPGPSCPHCGMPSAAGTKFCGACGKQFNQTMPPGAPVRATPIATPPPPVSNTRLLVVDEKGTVTAKHSISQEETTVGRLEADIAFADDTFMSPLHAMITMKEGQLKVRDLGSRNGTWLFIEEPYKMTDGDMVLVGSQVLRFRRLGYPGPTPPERDATRRMGSLVPTADIASLTQLRSDQSARDVMHLSPGRTVTIGRERGDWIFPYDPSMSSTHAQVRSEDADFIVQDAGSRNGVAVAVRSDRVIKAGSRVLVGDKLLKVEIG